VYHLELRKFPHTACRFNQSEREVLAIALAWVKGEWVEQGERKWNPQEATLTVLEGPELAMSELAMGRGWRKAQRSGQDVTERVLAAARAGAASNAAAAGAVPADPSQAADLLADSLGLELLALLADRELAPVRAWELACTRLDGGSAAEGLALAERAVRSLLRRGLIGVRRRAEGEGPGEDPELTAEEIEVALAAAETWSAADAPGAVVLAREI